MSGRPGARRGWRRRSVLLPAAVVLALVVAAGLVWFEPWKLVVDAPVAEPAPVAAAPGGVPAAAPVVLASGTLVAHEHATTGRALLLALPDGSRVLRLQDLATSNGPRLRVWLTDAPVLPGRDGWYVFDDGRHLDLGPLKGNVGSANYPVPAGADLTGLTSVSIWCERFSVSFGAATLAA
ncbi:DM13 domain-containing protein [Pseudonocardia kujensis]|uniref:DM13 domain-containing protein n=1 Tax=Pseudonocardia kujensis TaxID=1128675 RepID=UPI001E593140|nr:DM13 domain-containing protein [Pseudonocardia kujensis]MCE0764331.1 DM13 domain-containing protein [Pseudonocardia kujensis]